MTKETLVADDILELMRRVERERRMALEAAKGRTREPIGALDLVYSKGEVVYDRASGEAVRVESGIRGRVGKD